MKKLNAYLVIILLTVLVIPSVAFASWWNPFSWHWYNIFNIFSKSQTSVVQPVQQNRNNQNSIITNTKPIPTQNWSAGYQLLKQPRGDESTRYLDDGIVGSGTYAGYHKVIGLQIAGEMGRAVAYYVFITQDYKTFYFDPQLSQNKTYDLSLFDQTKVVGEVSGVPLNQPESISMGNFVLARQNYYSTETFDGYTVGKNSNELTSNVPGLRFFANNPAEDSSQNYPDLTNYFAGNTTLKVQDQFGLIFNYNLVSKENYARQLQISQLPDSDPNRWKENPFYSNTDFNSGFISYSSYDVPFPGVCGQVNSMGYVLKGVSLSDLISVGVTQNGTQLYALADKNSPLNQKEFKLKITNMYEGYQGAQSQAEKMNGGTLEPSYTDYIAKNPIIIFKDPWNRFVALGEFQYQLIGGCGKPVIYLYPQKPTEVKVSFEKSIRFTTDIPTYKNGWDVLANPNGLLKDLQPQYTDCSKINANIIGSEYAGDACKNNAYPYLYWAGQVDNIYPQADTGWLVAKEDLKSFIDGKLATIGLNGKERADMVGYWVPELTAKNVPFYRISFFQTADMNKFAPMNIIPKPDTVIRVFLDWLPLDNSNLNIQPEKLNHIDRKGFTVVEWGGLKQ